MDRKTFFGVPSLGGWLSMLNAVVLYAMPFIAYHDYYTFESPAWWLFYYSLMLPVGWLFQKPIGGCINPVTSAGELQFICIMYGVNCFAWGYGLAAIFTRTARAFRRITGFAHNQPEQSAIG